MAEEPKKVRVANKPRRRWFQFSLRTLLIGVTVAACGLGWLGVRVKDARKQAAAVTAVEKLGGFVCYDFQADSMGDGVSAPGTPGPAWLRAILGDDFFRSVWLVTFAGTSITDAELQRLGDFEQLNWLILDGTLVSDAGLEHLKGLRQLKRLSLNNTSFDDERLEHLKEFTQLRVLELMGTEVTGRGVDNLHQALPNCQILR